MYPTTPTQTIGGVSIMVTASTISFLFNFEPGRLASRTIWVIPALNPKKAVKWGFCDGSSFGNDFTFPRWRAARFFGRNPTCPWRGAENFRWDYNDRGNNKIHKMHKQLHINGYEIYFLSFCILSTRLTMLKVVNKRKAEVTFAISLVKLIDFKPNPEIH